MTIPYEYLSSWALLTAFALCVGSFIGMATRRLPIIIRRSDREIARTILQEDGEQGDGNGGEADGRETDEGGNQPRASEEEGRIDAAASERFDLSHPRSHCPNCRQPIAIRDMIPLWSYLFLRGHCRHCRQKIPLRYPLIELTALGIALLSAAVLGLGLDALWLSLLGWLLLTAAVIDFEHLILPDSLTLGALWIGLAVNSQGFLVPPEAAILGAMSGYLALLGINLLFRSVRGKTGMGAGDFKLSAALGAWLGWQPLPALLLLASTGALLAALISWLNGRMKLSDPLPFGPWLALSGWCFVLWKAA